MSIVKASTSTNTNIVFPCKLCSGNINDRDAALEFDMCQFWVHLRCNKLNLLTINIFKDLLILGFVYHVVV